MEKQISIIIPTYNMEAYIGKCLDSLLIPEFDQVEVLVVNDGSRDRSSEIAHSYADRYPNSIRVIDKPNGNYGSCINTALPLATGRYVKILDADDTFETAAFSRFVRRLPTLTDDAIITSFMTVDENGNIQKVHEVNNDKVEENMTYSLEDFCNLELFIHCQMHKLAYNRNIFINYHYHQTEGISYTDTEWAIMPFSKCETFRICDLKIYKYLVGRNGQTMDSHQILKNISNFFKIAHRLCEIYELENEQVSKRFLLYRIAYFYEFIYFHLYRSWNSKTSAIFQKEDIILKEKCPDIYLLLNKSLLDQNVNFKIFSEIRKANYSPGFKVPVVVRLKISMAYRFNRFLKFSTK